MKITKVSNTQCNNCLRADYNFPRSGRKAEAKNIYEVQVNHTVIVLCEKCLQTLNNIINDMMTVNSKD